MRELGLALVVLGIAAFAWLGLISGPEPEWLCGGAPNVLVAIVGYSGEPDELEAACQRSARWETIKAVGIGGMFVVVGLALILGARRGPSGYGTRSPDGRWWWDGHRWQRVPLPPPPPPPPRS